MAALIQELRIENFAIVDRLELSLEAGLTVLTGETGAGKSILIGAIIRMQNYALNSNPNSIWLESFKQKRV